MNDDMVVRPGPKAGDSFGFFGTDKIESVNESKEECTTLSGERYNVHALEFNSQYNTWVTGGMIAPS